MKHRSLLSVFNNNLKPNLQISANEGNSKLHPKQLPAFYFSAQHQASHYKATLYHA
ncbi:hypothetical protein [Alteromonas macleodii]|uniref:hypothetical protein n=1 Tax=Alteromonas macleodii TaxID=28108 RepID=UPI0022AF1A18|nr:hypothetical protein [Alteromonas macleodii]MCZ4241084.1 hypothetical protein [Alteromonas macleodii]